jgi:hypothetical protein
VLHDHAAPQGPPAMPRLPPGRPRPPRTTTPHPTLAPGETRPRSSSTPTTPAPTSSPRLPQHPQRERPPSSMPMADRTRARLTTYHPHPCPLWEEHRQKASSSTQTLLPSQGTARQSSPRHPLLPHPNHCRRLLPLMDCRSAPRLPTRTGHIFRTAKVPHRSGQR